MKKIALIHDLSGFGKCSLTAAIPVISVMGMQACPLPTAVLSSQTGFDSYFYDDYTDNMNAITDEWTKLDVSFDGIYSGFLASPKQVSCVLHFLDCFQTNNTLYLADPVLGDNGHPFKIFSDELLEGMKALCARSYICTPNLTELCLLTGTSYAELTSLSDEPDYLDKIAFVGKELLKTCKNTHYVLITGITRTIDGKVYIGNMAVSNDASSEYIYCESAYTGKGFSGTGDLFASVICGSLVAGHSIKDAMEKAIYFLQPAIEEATREEIPSVHGIHFEKYLSNLC